MTFADFLNQHWGAIKSVGEFLGVLLVLWFADKVMS
jgi:hypothetical protein